MDNETFTSGEKIRLVPEGREARFIGVVRGLPMITEPSLGTCQVTWDRIEKLAGNIEVLPPDEVMILAREVPPPAIVEADIVEEAPDSEPEKKQPLVEVPSRITKKWLAGLTTEQLEDLISSRSDLTPTRMVRLQEELTVRL